MESALQSADDFLSFFKYSNQVNVYNTTQHLASQTFNNLVPFSFSVMWDTSGNLEILNIVLKDGEDSDKNEDNYYRQ